MSQKSYLPIEDLCPQEFLVSTCKQRVTIVLGINDDPLPLGNEEQSLAKYNLANTNYRPGMTVGGAFKIKRLQNISENDIIVNIEREEVIVYLLQTANIRLYQHGMTIDKAREVVAALAAASENKNR